MANNDPFSDLIRSIEENLERNGGWRPPEEPQEPRRVPQGRPNRRLWWLLVPLALLILYNVGVGFLTDSAWYRSLGYSSVYFTRLGAATLLFVAGALITWLVIAANIWLARRLEPFGLVGTPVEQIAAAFNVPVVPALLVLAALYALLTASGLAGEWQELLLYFNQAPFAVNDPVFGLDVSFFVFTLPAWEMLRGWLLVMLVGAIIAVVFTAGVGWRGWNLRRPILMHLAVLAALVLALIAWQYRLDAYQIVYSTQGTVFGGGYTDIHAQLPAYNLLALVTLAAAVILVAAAWLGRGWRWIGGVLIAWVLAAILAGMVYPAIVQRFQVAPNELTLEKPYIQNNINYTRAAYNLDKIQESSYRADRELSPQGLLAQPDTMRNVRLWDYRPLLQTYNQIQVLRQYYAFNDVDVDRYRVDDRLEQVMVAARELAQDRLNSDAQTWVNLKLVYTHGYGAAISPAAKLSTNGLPDFYAKDLPVTGTIPITQPEVYFGELTNDYVIGATGMEEFNYPLGNGYATTHFAANTGIPMSWANRLLFALRFADINLLLNQDILPESQLLWRRNIMERVELLAPFLRYDSDPYLAVGADGHMYWIVDAYTETDRYPYSQPYRDELNYIRNPVKVVVNAYDGAVNFYVIDEQEPILAAYRKIFPALFKPKSEIPPAIVGHLRYPTDLFSAQAEMYRTYHMINPVDFYNKEDVWAWPQEIFGTQPVPIEPYYVLMELPNSNELDYIQILPFTPANRDNMVAWMAAQSSLDNYGQMVVYEFGKDSLFFGPQQIEARIDQDPAISAQLSLWNQQGSSVVRGNLLVIPIGNSLLYVEPLYLQAENGKIPELKRVVLATATRVVMADSLGAALVRLFGNEIVSKAGLTDLILVQEAGGAGATGATATAGGNAGGSASGGNAAASGGQATVEELIVAANQHYAQAQANLRNGDWAGYGTEMQALQQVITQMAQAAGVQLETPAPSVTPGAAPAGEATDTPVVRP